MISGYKNKRRFFFSILLMGLLQITWQVAYATDHRDSLEKELAAVIEQSAVYDLQKMERIATLKRGLNTISANAVEDRYNYYEKLYEEYKVFRFDTAFLYARQLNDLALSMKDPIRVGQSKVRLMFVLVSA